GSVGMPLPDVEMRVVDTRDGAAMAAGEVGEILIRAPQLMARYWDDPPETAAPVRDHAGQRWLHTGDLGYLDDDGYLFIVDRMKDLIKTHGYQVWPREIEEVLASHPAVAEVGGAGGPDEAGGGGARGGGGGGGRRARRGQGRGGQGVGGAAARPAGRRRGAAGVLPRAPRPLQGAGHGRVPRRAPQVDGGQGAAAGPHRRARASCLTRVISSYGSNGLTTKSSAPARRATSWSAVMKFAVSRITGMAAPRSSARSRAQTVLPSLPAISPPRWPTSGWRSRALVSASWPSRAVTTWKPSRRRLTSTKRTMSASSSATSTVPVSMAPSLTPASTVSSRRRIFSLGADELYRAGRNGPVDSTRPRRAA